MTKRQQQIIDLLKQELVERAESGDPKPDSDSGDGFERILAVALEVFTTPPPEIN